MRSLSGVEIHPNRGITAITGPNGSGKTNLLEGLYFGLTGRSFRTSDRRDLIPHGGSLARAEVDVEDDAGIRQTFLASVTWSEGRRHLLDGNPVDAKTAARNRPYVAVFAPDRLQLIKGPPSERRAHIDAFIAARWPGRADLRIRFGKVLAQRNALISRVGANLASESDLDSWDQSFARIASALIEARREATQLLTDPFRRAAADLGLYGEGSIAYAPRADGGPGEIARGLAERRSADLKLGRSGWGPHLDELKVELDGRSLRRFGSQGQQRSGLLALLFAEREVLAESSAVPPLLLLDDVMSELDPDRRELLGERMAVGGQCLITAADTTVLPAAAKDDGYRFEAGTLGPA